MRATACALLLALSPTRALHAGAPAIMRTHATRSSLAAMATADDSETDAAPSPSTRSCVDVGAEHAECAEHDDELWDEPVLESWEEEEDGSVASVAKYYPSLLRAKYGDDWQLLLLDDEAGEGTEQGEGVEGDEEDPWTEWNSDGEAEGTLVDVFEEEEEGGELTVSPTEEELHAMLADSDGGGASMGASADDEALRAEADANDAFGEAAQREQSGGASSADEPESAARAGAVSPQLAAFVSARREGAAAGVPRPFPDSEWLQVFVAAMGEARYREVEATWANLRVCVSHNFDDLQVGDDSSAPPDALGSALRKARALFAATGLPALAETTCMHLEAESTRPASETMHGGGHS